MAKIRPCVAVDAMGGDFGPDVVVPGAVAAARGRKIDLILVGVESRINAALGKLDVRGLDIKIAPATEIAGMDEKPSETMRRKKDTSIQVCSKLVRDGLADGLVSAGNSGTTLACGMFIIGRIPGVERPALAAFLPTEKRPIVLIDVGANVDCKPLHLMQFGIMADVLARDLLGFPNPRVGLMSIGEEEGKGNIQVIEAFELFRMSSLNFVGNVEGRDLFTGDVDVVVCDGFVGNVALKLSEGLGSSLGRILRGELKRGFFAQIGTILALAALKRFGRLMDYAEYGGAPLIGLKGIAIVCHGKSNAKAIANAVDMASTFVTKKANDHLEENLAVNKDFALYAHKRSN